MYFYASCFPRRFFMVILVLLEQMQWRAGLLAVLLWTLLSTKSCQSYCTQYGELTPLDPYLTENSNYTLNCTLDQTVIDGIRYNSSQLHLHSFVPGLNPLPQHTREEPDERTVLFHIEAVPNKGRNYENQYYCYAGDNGFLRGKCIGATILHVGPKPQPPTSVSCIVYAQRSMTCSYEIPQQEDAVTLLWGVQSRVNRGQVTTPFYCTNFTKTSCTWSGHGRDSFHANTVYWIALYTNNSFGHAFAEGDPDIPGTYFKVNASLIVKPDPIELRKISSGKRNLTLEWQESSDGQRRNQMAYNYTVHYNCTTPWGGEEVLKREVHKLTKVKLENLWPDIEYRVGVTAIPVIGGYDSDMKNTLTVRTLPDAPASPPINRPELFYRDESCGLNCQNIKLFWQPVLPMDRNGEITHYLVTPNGTSNSMYVDNRAYTYTVEKILSPKEKHTMQLQAITKGGSSPIAYYYIPSVSEDPPMVKQLAVTKVDNNTKVLMTWRVPDDFTVTLFWCKSTAEICNESPSWQTISGKNSSFQVPFNGTEAFEEFQYAAAVTVNGISGGLTWSQCLYQEGAVPARGPVLKSTSLQPHNQVTVEWAQMSCEETGSAQVVAYVVEYAYVTEELNCSNIKSSVWERVSLDDPETFIWSMEDLEAGKTMCVRVAAKSIVGLGPFSIPKMVRISGLLKGEIAGITIGVVVCTVLIILGIILCFKSGRNCYKYMFKKIEINIPESLEEYTVNYHGASNGGFVSVSRE
ncbi:uncharacterized protein LOC106151265 isoform X1 [Lingula anatina]|uniref:Uncharacterized protein LOC106151265 isoform X1 n=1 Tax=Lingula anatina TaxID=7574 RepID=A0A1S3H160_LINAN|nr:uncharacterized protein LOC106151265 isoform X1 [Lingula anatina]XP_013379876.1 uncharacterized protein LOC106151265 isoform X1 [Lingula anatina]XP_013379877.1 uncharacterized protein LOC106151265 isoform X1 [Lingula anatina]|eukprot:XP_013379875.1 uncharacterized protein LOC106151265 isoform X1 [Lingula anatina]